MKKNSVLTTCGVGLVALNLMLLPSFASDSVDNDAIRATLSSVPTLELGAKAAQLVKQAPAQLMNQTAKEAVLASVKISPAATVAVVGAIAKETFEAAPAAAGAAANKMPKLAVAIAKAAATAAPSQAGKIVEAICKAVPKQYKEVALAVDAIVPSAGQDILDGVAVALPSLKSFIAGAQAHYGATDIVPVGAVLNQANVASQSAMASGGSVRAFEPVLSPPPVQNPPFQPYPGTTTEINSGSNTNSTPGGREYSGP